MIFGGTITVPFDHLLRLLEDNTVSTLDNGFEAILLLNGHGGNMLLIDNAVYTIGTSQVNVEINGLTYFQLAEPFIDDVRESDIGGMSHAGEFETSLMMHLFPELMSEADGEGRRLESTYDIGLRYLFDIGPLTTYKSFEDYAPEYGTLGKPRPGEPGEGEAAVRGPCRRTVGTPAGYPRQ